MCDGEAHKAVLFLAQEGICSIRLCRWLCVVVLTSFPALFV